MKVSRLARRARALEGERLLERDLQLCLDMDQDSTGFLTAFFIIYYLLRTDIAFVVTIVNREIVFTLFPSTSHNSASSHFHFLICQR